jgi:hypothetical protein
MVRLTLADVQRSRLPGLLGICATDSATIAGVVNATQERLVYGKESSDEGWIGAWARMAIELTQEQPYFTAPREVARIERLDQCTYPITVQNEFFEFLQFGWGLWPKSQCATTRCAPMMALDRGSVPVFTDLTLTAKLRIYLTDSADAGQRVLVQGKDANGIPIRTLEGGVLFDGEFVVLSPPFVDTVNSFSVITGLQKSQTIGRVNFYQLDPDTADETLISFMEPGETVAGYRRYYVSGLPTSCCNPPPVTPGTVQLTALVKLALLPVVAATDYLTIQSIEALTQEAQALRYDGIDDPNAKQMAAYHHRSAIRLLQGQSIHEQGKLTPAVNFAPFGSARLELIKVGYLI